MKTIIRWIGAGIITVVILLPLRIWLRTQEPLPALGTGTV